MKILSFLVPLFVIVSTFQSCAQKIASDTSQQEVQQAQASYIFTLDESALGLTFDQKFNSREAQAKAYEKFKKEAQEKVIKWANTQLAIQPENITQVLTGVLTGFTARLNALEEGKIIEWVNQYPELLDISKDQQIELPSYPSNPVIVDTLRRQN